MRSGIDPDISIRPPGQMNTGGSDTSGQRRISSEAPKIYRWLRLLAHHGPPDAGGGRQKESPASFSGALSHWCNRTIECRDDRRTWLIFRQRRPAPPDAGGGPAERGYWVANHTHINRNPPAIIARLIAAKVMCIVVSIGRYRKTRHGFQRKAPVATENPIR